MTTGTITEPNDDDVVLVFRRGQTGMRRTSERITWKDLKAAVLASVPNQAGAIEEIRLQVAGVSKSTNDALLAATKARADADTAEAKARADADTAEAKARVDADVALAARQTIVQGTLVIPAGVSLLSGKMLRTALVSGIKSGENFNLTFKAALPAGLTLGESYSIKDGEITVVLLAISAVTISARVDCPFTVAILRPPTTGTPV